MRTERKNKLYNWKKDEKQGYSVCVFFSSSLSLNFFSSFSLCLCLSPFLTHLLVQNASKRLCLLTLNRRRHTQSMHNVRDDLGLFLFFHFAHVLLDSWRISDDRYSLLHIRILDDDDSNRSNEFFILTVDRSVFRKRKIIWNFFSFKFRSNEPTGGQSDVYSDELWLSSSSFILA